MASKEEWFHFIEEEEGEMFALDLIEDIIFNSQKVIFAKQVDKQILPYTVHFAEEAMNDMINFYYFQRDPGNVDALLWVPDDEPECVRIDSWAPASVPIKKPTNRLSKYAAPKWDDPPSQKDTYVPIPTPKKEKEKRAKDEAEAAAAAGAIRKPHLISVAARKPKAPAGLEIKQANGRRKNNAGPENTITSASNAYARKKPAVYNGPSKLGKLDSTMLGVEAEKSISEENKKFLLKIAANAAESGVGEGGGGKIDYTYDNNGRIVPLNATSSWNPIQEVKYKVSTGATSDDPDDSKMSLRASNIMYKRGVTGAGNRKGPLWTAPSKKTKSKKAEGEFENATVPKVVPREIESADTAGFQDDPKLSIPLLADTMKIVPGVTLREGEVVKTAPSNEYATNLQRITHTAASKDISLEKGVFETSQIKILEEIIAHSKPVTAAHPQL